MIVRVSAPQAALAVHGHLSWLVTDTPYPGPVNQPINVAAEPSEPILVTCEGSGGLRHSFLCPKCGQPSFGAARAPIEPHRRRDALAELQRGDFELMHNNSPIPLRPGMVVGSVTPTAPSVPIVDGHDRRAPRGNVVVVWRDGVIHHYGQRRHGFGPPVIDISGQILGPTHGQWATPINNPAPCEQRCPECGGEGFLRREPYECRCNGAGRCEPWPWTGDTEWDET